jgi:hypothetical protein
MMRAPTKPGPWKLDVTPAEASDVFPSERASTGSGSVEE